MMIAQTRIRRNRQRTARSSAFAGTVVLALALAACAGSEEPSAGPSPALPPDGLVTVAGYEYADSSGDPTAAAVVAAYEDGDGMLPPVELREDFESGAGPFWQGTDETGSVTVGDGALRITNSDLELVMSSYVDLDDDADSVLVTAEVAFTEALQADEGPAISVSRWDGDRLELDYQFALDGNSAYLWEATGPELDDVRLLDSAALPAPPTSGSVMNLWVFPRGDAVIGWLNGEPILSKEGVSGPLNTVELSVVSTGTPRTVDFEAVEVRALAVGEPAPTMFAGQSEHAVEQGGSQVATIVVLEPSDYLRDLPPIDTQTCCSILQESAPSGMAVRPDEVAGQSVVVGELEGTTFWVLVRDDSWRIVTAADAEAGRAFVEAFLLAQGSSGAPGDAQEG